MNSLIPYKEMINVDNTFFFTVERNIEQMKNNEDMYIVFVISELF